MKLTDVKCRQAKARDKAYTLVDGKGLGLEVAPNGSRYWRYRYELFGKANRISLGTYPDVPLAEARELRLEARKLVGAGICPLQARRETRRDREAQSVNTFERVARDWHKAESVTWSRVHARDLLHTLDRDVFPMIGGKPITDVTARDLRDVVKKVERRGALDVASRTLQRINKVMAYAVQHDIIGYNPGINLVGMVKTRKVVHRAAMAELELPNFFAELDAYEGDELTKLAMEFVLLTFVRSAEQRGMQWSEIDYETSTWRIPASRMKTGLEHLVPLSSQALEILEKIRTLELHSENVFPQMRKRRQIMSENCLLYALYRMGYHNRATVHGFRGTASTILNETGFPPDVIERQLAHVEGNAVRAAYNSAQYLPQRREMMQHWGDFLGTKRGSVNVVPIHGRT